MFHKEGLDKKRLDGKRLGIKGLGSNNSSPSSSRVTVGVARSPLSIWLMRISLFVIFLLSILVSFYSGKYYSGQAAFENDQLRKDNDRLNEVLDMESLNTATAATRSETAALAVEQVRKENLGLTKDIESLKRELSYFQRIMDPIRNDKGLRIDEIDLQATSDGTRKRFHIVLTQLGSKNHSPIRGNLTVIISGSKNGIKEDYALQDLKLSDKELTLKFHFKYFQEINEEFILPEDFLPETVMFTAQAIGNKSMRVERTETWTSLIK